MTTSWAEAQREALFKRVEGGFIFRQPGLPPRHYLVTETQKAEILSLMRAPIQITPKRILLVILVIILGLAGIFLVALALQLAFGIKQLSPVWLNVAISFYVVLFSGPLRFARITRSAQIRVLGRARQIDQRVTLLDRSRTYARLLALPKLLAAGVGCALGCIPCVILATFHKVGPFAFTGPPQDRVAAWFALVLLALLAVRFFYLAILKLSLGQSLAHAGRS